MIIKMGRQLLTPTDMAESAADQLQGTAQSFADLGKEFEHLHNTSIEFNTCIDELIFECETCNWWCEISEMSENEEWVCDECADE